MLKCTDKKIGILIHGYELGILNNDELDKFQLHLMECDYCFSQVRNFENYMSILRENAVVRAKIESSMQEPESTLSFGGQLIRYLWPKTPFIFRPLIPYALLITLIVASFIVQQDGTDSSGIRPVQSVRLTEMRSNGNNIVRLGPHQEVVLSFAVPRGSNSYDITIVSEKDNTTIFQRRLTGVNEFNMGEIILPLDNLSSGNYRINIFDSRVETVDTISYRFRVRD